MRIRECLHELQNLACEKTERDYVQCSRKSTRVWQRHRTSGSGTGVSCDGATKPQLTDDPDLILSHGFVAHFRHFNIQRCQLTKGIVRQFLQSMKKAESQSTTALVCPLRGPI